MNPTIQRLLAAATKAELDALTPEKLLAPARVASRDDAQLVKAALYLKHGYLEDCHKLAQSVATPTGSYWHGIMHRHEGDISNSRYWYNRVGRHPVLELIGGYPQDEATERREFILLLEHTYYTASGTSPTDTVSV
jgi:hypothetical protein